MVQIPSAPQSHTILQSINRFGLIHNMDRALDDVISERQVGTMPSPREQSTAADGGHSEKKPAGWQKK